MVVVFSAVHNGFTVGTVVMDGNLTRLQENLVGVRNGILFNVTGHSCSREGRMLRCICQFEPEVTSE